MNLNSTKNIAAEQNESNNRKALASKHVFAFLSLHDLPFLCSCKAIDKEWQAKKQIYYRARWCELMGRDLTEEESKEKNHETRFKELYSVIHTLSRASAWNIYATCYFESRFLRQCHGRLWFLRSRPERDTHLPPLTPYAFALFHNLPALANSILAGSAFKDEKLLGRRDGDLLFTRFRGEYDKGLSHEALKPNFAKLPSLVVLNTASFFLNIFTDSRIKGERILRDPNPTMTHLTGLHFLYHAGIGDQDFVNNLNGPSSPITCDTSQDEVSNRKWKIPPWDPRTVKAFNLALQTKLLDWEDLKKLFEMIVPKFVSAPPTALPLCLELVCSFLNNGLPVNIAALGLEKAGNNPENHDLLTRTRFLIRDLDIAFSTKNFSPLDKYLTDKEMQRHLTHLATWNYRTPNNTTITLEANAHLHNCINQFNQFNQFCSHLNPALPASDSGLSTLKLTI